MGDGRRRAPWWIAAGVATLLAAAWGRLNPTSSLLVHELLDHPVVLGLAGYLLVAWGVSLAGNGTLVTDDYSTTLVSTATQPPPTTGPSAQGQWTVLNYQMPIRAMHSTLLRNGKVLLIAGSGNSVDNFAAGRDLRR